MWKNNVEPNRSDDNMAHAHWMLEPITTNTHSDYVIVFAFPWNKWLHEYYTMLRYTYIASLLNYSLVLAWLLWLFSVWTCAERWYFHSILAAASKRPSSMPTVSTDINHVKTKHNLFCIRTRCVPRSKHYPPRLLTRIKFTKIRPSNKLLLVYK
jgi:hypothetical protein